MIDPSSSLRWWAWNGPAHLRRGRGRTLCGESLDQRACYAITGQPRCPECQRLGGHLVGEEPPSDERMALVELLNFAEVEAGRYRGNLDPSALGSFWQGYDKAMKNVAEKVRTALASGAESPAESAPAGRVSRPATQEAPRG